MANSKYNNTQKAAQAYAHVERMYGIRLGGHVDSEVVSVYLIGPCEGGPMKLGIAKHPGNRVSTIKSHNWNDVDIFGLRWFKSRSLALRVEAEAHQLLDKAGKRLRGEWFDVDADWGAKTIQVATDKLGIKSYSDEDMARMLTRQTDRGMQRYADKYLGVDR